MNLIILKFLVSIVFGISTLVGSLLLIYFAPNLWYFIRTKFSGRTPRGRPPSEKPGNLWILFWVSVAMTILTSAVGNSLADSPSTQSIPTPIPSETAKIFDVSSLSGWQDTVIYINSGEKVKIEVIAGQWTGQVGSAPYTNGEGDLGYRCGQDTCAEPLPSAPTGALIGQIGDMIFEIGSGTSIISQANGNLHLRMNDADMRDNEGYLQVRISK